MSSRGPADDGGLSRSIGTVLTEALGCRRIGSQQTHRWREMDSNFEYAGAVNRAVTPARLRRVGAPFLPTILSGTRPKATRSAIAVAGSLRRLPTRRRQLGASKGVRTSSPRPRTRSSNPVPSSAESANYRFRARLPTLVRVASSASAFGLVPKTRSRRAQARSDGRPQQRAALRGPLASTRDQVSVGQTISHTAV